jgi:hypothetical protein
MTEPSGGKRPVSGQRDSGTPAESWEQRAAGMANDIQRWLIKKSARNVRDELGGQVKKAFRGSERKTGDSWATATTEPPHAADEAPECAWCPVCRAARRLAQARSGADAHGGGPRISDAADVMAGAMRDALAGIDSILSYRPSGTAQSGQSGSPDARPGEPARPAEKEESDAKAGSGRRDSSHKQSEQPWAQATEAEHLDDPTERA